MSALWSCPRARRVVALTGACWAAAACGSSDTTTQALRDQAGGGTATLAIGASANLANGSALAITASIGGEFVLIVADTLTTTTGSPAAAFQISATGVTAAGSASAPATSLAPLPDASGALATGLPALDIAYGARLNAAAAPRLRPRFLNARQHATSFTSLSRSVAVAAPQVGDVINYNVSERACDSVVSHPARVVAIGSKALIAVDTLDPPGGFATADYQRFAATFDTLVYPLDVSNFGEPTDIDANGHVVLLFTRAVNELTKRGSDSFVGGFFFARDLFPTTATIPTDACAGSNNGELFYLLAPDPGGIVNGNARSRGFVDSLTTSVIAHEFQHLINASRRIYVSDANDFEVVWLNEGLSHVAEELLFYRESGLQPRQNISLSTLRGSTESLAAFNTDQGSNAGRYRQYLLAPNTNSPIRKDDSLATRGATWDFLRYAADRKLRGSSGPDAVVWQALVNSKVAGVANLRAVFGADVGGLLRDWSVSQYVDDVVVAASADFTQASWNWHSIYPALGSRGGAYPLVAAALTTSGVTASVIPGGAAYYRFAVPAGKPAAITLSAASGGSTLAGVIVRLR